MEWKELPKEVLDIFTKQDQEKEDYDNLWKEYINKFGPGHETQKKFDEDPRRKALYKPDATKAQYEVLNSWAEKIFLPGVVIETVRNEIKVIGHYVVNNNHLSDGGCGCCADFLGLRGVKRYKRIEEFVNE